MKKIWFVFSVVTILVYGSVLSVNAAEATKEGIRSVGRWWFLNGTPDDITDDVIFDANDLYFIAERIDVLKEICK